MVFPSMTKDPSVTDWKLLRSARTTPSSRKWPRTVLPVARCVADRNPVLSPDTVIRSSLLLVPTSLILSSVESYDAVTPAPALLIFVMSDESVSLEAATEMLVPLMLNEPDVTEPNCEVLDKTC